ncbi:hypothetical protein [Phormidesmis priestleyi]
MFPSVNRHVLSDPLHKLRKPFDVVPVEKNLGDFEGELGFALTNQPAQQKSHCAIVEQTADRPFSR